MLIVTSSWITRVCLLFGWDQISKTSINWATSCTSLICDSSVSLSAARTGPWDSILLLCILTFVVDIQTYICHFGVYNILWWYFRDREYDLGLMNLFFVHSFTWGRPSVLTSGWRQMLEAWLRFSLYFGLLSLDVVLVLRCSLCWVLKQCLRVAAVNWIWLK